MNFVDGASLDAGFIVIVGFFGLDGGVSHRLSLQNCKFFPWLYMVQKVISIELLSESVSYVRFIWA